MIPHNWSSPRPRVVAAAALSALALAALLVAFAIRPLEAQREATATHGHHAEAGGPGVLGASYADTFVASSMQFNADGVSNDGIDTVRISVGDSILWLRVSLTHTVTSGTGSSDPQAGALFEGQLSSFSTRFTHTFTSPGTFPFFCRPHELSNMRGVVVVEAPVGVRAIASEPGAVGFIGRPIPNPSRAGVAIRFALDRPGAARLEVVSAGGRRVAILVEESLAAGAYAAHWDRRTSVGERAPAGIYFLKLAIPGAMRTEKLLIVD